MTESEWLDVLALWADVWPDRQLSDRAAATWFLLLADGDGDAVLEALAGWARDPGRPWPPRSPGELRGAAEPEAEHWTAALARLRDTMRAHPYYDPPRDLDAGLAGYVASMGGWSTLCRRLDVTDAATRAQFRDHWQASSARAARSDAGALPDGMMPALNPGRDTDGR